MQTDGRAMSRIQAVLRFVVPYTSTDSAVRPEQAMDVGGRARDSVSSKSRLELAVKRQGGIPAQSLRRPPEIPPIRSKFGLEDSEATAGGRECQVFREQWTTTLYPPQLIFGICENAGREVGVFVAQMAISGSGVRSGASGDWRLSARATRRSRHRIRGGATCPAWGHTCRNRGNPGRLIVFAVMDREEGGSLSLMGRRICCSTGSTASWTLDRNRTAEPLGVASSTQAVEHQVRP